MDDQRDEPVDLSPLVEVESPSVVARAIRRFRLRVLIWSGAVLGLLAVIVGAFLFLTVRPNLDTPARIQRAAEDLGAFVVPATGVHRVGRFEVVVVTAVELRPSLGQRLLQAVARRGKDARATPIGLQIVVVHPTGSVDGIHVRPKDWALFEDNVFADAPTVTRQPGSEDPGRTFSVHWLIIEPRPGSETIDMVVTVSDQHGITTTAGDFSIHIA